jgi:type I restriction enzyme S subunit|nr:MAG TPA: hypothetical protein [Caudoviricetes sp.]
MTAQELKNSILQLAVQGKLVPQCKEDEPASELLKRIRADKEKVGKKEKPLPEITEDEIPFEIPENWEWVRLGEIGSLLSGYAFKSTEYEKSGVQVVRISDLADDTVSTKDAVYYSKKDELNQYLVVKNSFLICLTGSIGKMAWVQDNIPRYLNQRVGMYISYDVSITPYLWLFLHSPYVINQWTASKTSTNGNIKNSNVTEALCPIPPLAEQERIVAKIEKLMPLVEEYGKAEEQLTKLNDEFPDKLRKSILQQAVQGKLTERDPVDEPASELIKRIKTEKEALIKSGKIKKEKLLPAITDKEKPFDIPDTWEWVRLAEISEMCLGKMLDKTKNKGVLHPYLRNVNVRWGAFDLTDILQMKFENDEEEKYSVKYGDLVVCEGGEPGRCAVWSDKDSTFRIQKALHRIRFSSCVDPFFGYRVFEYYACNGYFSKRFSGETIKHLPGAVLANIAFPLPPLAEQKRIVKRVEELLALCDELK